MNRDFTKETYVYMKRDLCTHEKKTYNTDLLTLDLIVVAQHRRDPALLR